MDELRDTNTNQYNISETRDNKGNVRYVIDGDTSNTQFLTRERAENALKTIMNEKNQKVINKETSDAGVKEALKNKKNVVITNNTNNIAVKNPVEAKSTQKANDKQIKTLTYRDLQKAVENGEDPKEWMKKNGYIIGEQGKKYLASVGYDSNGVKIPTQKANDSQIKIEEAPSTEADITSREVQNNLDNQKFAKYANKNYRSTLGAIFGDSGLSFSERLQMGSKALGKLLGNSALANGMSLLGDNSYFSKISDGLDFDSMTSDQQKKIINAMSDQMAQEATDIKANSTVVDRELAGLDKAKKDYLSASAHTLISLDDDSLEQQLSTIKLKDSNGNPIQFTDEEIEQFKMIKPMLQNNSKTTRGNASDIVETKTKQRNFKFENFKSELEKKTAINSLRTRLSELEKQKLELGNEYNVNKVMDVYGKFAQTMGGIGSSSFTSSATQNASNQSSSNFSANVGVNIPYVSGGVSGGSTWGNSQAVGSSNGTSTTFNENYKYGGERGERAYKKWWNENGQKVYKSLVTSIDKQIKAIKDDIRELENMSIKVNDTTIENGDIESITLKNGETLTPNENDGAIITTNEVPKTCLTFKEGELNPFEYLGYEGKKYPHEYYEKLLNGEKQELDYESALSLIDSL